VKKNALRYIFGISCLVLMGFAATGCQKKPAVAAAGGGMQGLPVQTAIVKLEPVPQSSEYVATIKSRRSATVEPQVMGMLTQIRVHSGDQVKAGQVMMEIDPHQQLAALEAAQGTERQKQALYDFNKIELDRQTKLFQAGVTSKDVYEQEQQAYQNAKADYDSAVGARKTQEQLLAFYTIRAPFDGVVGDVPVHVGDFVAPMNSPPSILTTVDEGKDLEAYIYIPTERSSEVRKGLEVDLTDTNGKLLEKTNIDFVSPEVDPTMQEILAKAPVHLTPQTVRTAQLVKARVVWSTTPMAVVPVLAVSRQGGQSFVFLARQKDGHTVAVQTPITLGDTVGNSYSVSSGLTVGDKVIVTSTQFLVDGMPVLPLGG
jgi:RND family efflux transporter MFP subunit